MQPETEVTRSVPVSDYGISGEVVAGPAKFSIALRNFHQNLASASEIAKQLPQAPLSSPSQEIPDRVRRSVSPVVMLSSPQRPAASPVAPSRTLVRQRSVERHVADSRIMALSAVPLGVASAPGAGTSASSVSIQSPQRQVGIPVSSASSGSYQNMDQYAVRGGQPAADPRRSSPTVLPRQVSNDRAAVQRFSSFEQLPGAAPTTCEPAPLREAVPGLRELQRQQLQKRQLERQQGSLAVRPGNVGVSMPQLSGGAQSLRVSNPQLSGGAQPRQATPPQFNRNAAYSPRLAPGVARQVSPRSFPTPRPVPTPRGNTAAATSSGPGNSYITKAYSPDIEEFAL